MEIRAKKDIFAAAEISIVAMMSLSKLCGLNRGEK